MRADSSLAAIVVQDLWRLGAAELAGAIRAREISSHEAVESPLARSVRGLRLGTAEMMGCDARELIGKSICPRLRCTARFGHSPAPRSRFDGAQCSLCCPKSRYW